MAQAFFGGVHPKEMKNVTGAKIIEQITPPKQVIIHLSQQKGEVCRPLVKVGEHVKLGQRIGEPMDFASVPVHASISGTVKAVEPRPHPAGGNMPAVVIENDFRSEVHEDVRAPKNLESLTVPEMIGYIRKAGVVGMGGAAFSTHMKIAQGIGKVKTVIVNGVESEPYVTSDLRTILERTDLLVGGCEYLARMFGTDAVIIAVESGRKSVVSALNKVIAAKKAPVVVKPLRNRYPQGGEKQLCQTITGFQIPPGGQAADIGCAVFNVSTVCAIFRAIAWGTPVLKKIVTVSGSAVAVPKNLECPVGTPISDLFDDCGGLKEKTHKIVMGGPMKGEAQYTAEVPVCKNTDAVLAFAGWDERERGERQCIRCGRCAAVCPMHLQPLFLYRYASRNMLEELEEANATDCMGCGTCAYVCPARLQLVQMIAVGKRRLEEKQAAEMRAEAERMEEDNEE